MRNNTCGNKLTIGCILVLLSTLTFSTISRAQQAEEPEENTDDRNSLNDNDSEDGQQPHPSSFLHYSHHHHEHLSTAQRTVNTNDAGFVVGSKTPESNPAERETANSPQTPWTYHRSLWIFLIILFLFFLK